MVYGGGPFDLITKFRSLMGRIHPTLGDLMGCMMCFPTNVGLLLSLGDIFLLPDMSITPFSILLSNDTPWYIIVFGDMFYASGTTWLIHTFQEMMENLANIGAADDE